MSQPPFDLPQAHRWFAVEFNNRSWELVESAARTPDEAEQMIDFAHASAIHWRHAGTHVNELRAQCLLATAYAAAGLADPAVRHAEKCLSLSREAADEQTPWDRASAHGCAANAYAMAGDLVRARSEHRSAIEATALLDHLDDVPLFERLFPAP